jgi:hypothetical protein
MMLPPISEIVAIALRYPRNAGQVARDRFPRLLIAAITAGIACSVPWRPVVAGDAVPIGAKTALTPAADPVPRWLQTTWRRSHLAGPNYEEIQGHLDAGAQLVIANCDNLFQRLGEFAVDTPKDQVADADRRLREFVSYVQQRKARAGIYCGPIHVTYWRKDLALRHPEWLQVGADGKPRFPTGPEEQDRGVRACTYGPYGELLIRQLTTLAKQYSLDAFWFDGNNFPLDCHCTACRKAFQETTGGPLEVRTGPSTDAKAQEFLAWRFRNYVDYLTRLTREVHRARPDCTVHFNFSSLREWGRRPWFPEYPAVYALSQDCPSLELWWHMPGDAIHQGLATQFLRAEARERPTAVWIQPQAHGIMGVSSPVEIMSRFLHAVANGAVPEVVEATQRREYVADIYRAIRQREEYLVDARWLRWGAMLVSERTKMHYGAELPMERTMECVLGGFKAIQEEHLPVRLITDQDIEEGFLGDYSVLYLPNAACLSDRAVGQIRSFVQSGGGLVASQCTSLYDETGRRRDDFALADLFHARYCGEVEFKDRERPACFVPADDAISGDPVVERCESKGWGTPPDLKHGDVFVTGNLVLTTPTEGGTSGARFKKIRPDDKNDQSPLYVTGVCGKGKVVYFALGLEKHCYNYGDPFARRMIRNALVSVARSGPPVTIDAPVMLQTTFYEQKEKHRLVVHLLNDQSSWGRHSLHWEEGFSTTVKTHAYPQREEVVPLCDLVAVTIQDRRIRAVYQEPGHVRLDMQKIGSGVRVKVPKVELHDLVVAETEE